MKSADSLVQILLNSSFFVIHGFLENLKKII